MWRRANILMDGADKDHWGCWQEGDGRCPDTWQSDIVEVIQFPRHAVAASLALDGIDYRELP